MFFQILFLIESSKGLRSVCQFKTVLLIPILPWFMKVNVIWHVIWKVIKCHKMPFFDILWRMEIFITLTKHGNIGIKWTVSMITIDIWTIKIFLDYNFLQKMDILILTPFFFVFGLKSLCIRNMARAGWIEATELHSIGKIWLARNLVFLTHPTVRILN